MNQYFGRLIAATLTLICAPSISAQVATPDLVFFNGRVVTMDGALTEAQAIAIADEEIVAVGSTTDVLALRGPGTRVFDLEGRTLAPGFVDAHTHILNDAGRMGLDLESAQDLALSHGITTLANMFSNEGFVGEMQAMEQRGELRIRTSLYLVAVNNCGIPRGDWYRDFEPTRERGERLRIGGVKVFLDGGTCGRAALSVPRPNGLFGDLFFEQPAFDDLIAQIDEDGYQVVIHAIGDNAVEVAQNSLEAALAGRPNYLRHRIDHNVIVRPELLPRYGQIGIIPALFGWHRACQVVAGSGWIWTVGLDRAAWVSPNRALLDANPGLPVAWHGDDPWVGPVSPLEELHSLVTRRDYTDPANVCDPPDWFAQNALDVGDALRMMTTGSAYALDRDKEVGSLEPGKLADLVMLSDNPLRVDSDAIRDIQVLMTMIGGEVVFGHLPAETTGVLGGSDERHSLRPYLSAYPNPTRGIFQIRYHAGDAGAVSLAVYDITGRRVASLFDGMHHGSVHYASWDGKTDDGRIVPAGPYLVRLSAGGTVTTIAVVRLW